AEVGEGGADHLGAAVVAVLAHLRHQDPGPAARGRLELPDLLLDRLEGVVALVGGAVHARDATDLRLVAAEDRLHGVAHLADGGPGPRRLDAEGEQVAVAGRPLAEALQRGVARRLVPLGPDALEAG